MIAMELVASQLARPSSVGHTHTYSNVDHSTTTEQRDCNYERTDVFVPARHPHAVGANGSGSSGGLYDNVVALRSELQASSLSLLAMTDEGQSTSCIDRDSTFIICADTSDHTAASERGHRELDSLLERYSYSSMEGSTMDLLLPEPWQIEFGTALSIDSLNLDSPPYSINSADDQSKEVRCWEHRCNGRKFANRRNYNRHMQELARQIVYTCSRCDAEFSRRSNRNAHMQRCKMAANMAY